MINDKIIKVCGMSDAENIRKVEQLGVDMMGFIFYPKSPRCICELPAYMPDKPQRVGVFVNEDKKEIEMLADRFDLDYIQLHGNESPEYCRSLQSTGLRIIKALSIARRNDFDSAKTYEGFCDYFLFDTKYEHHGGSGNQFDWALLNNYTGKTPFILSGGINLYSAKALKALHHPRLAGFDINSRFELKPGLKDVERIKEFLDAYASK